jgi:2-dehydro-3-deoxygluconokinase
MNKIFCFGELLLRMSPELDRQWIRDTSMPVYVGGAELNVATALANWKLPVGYCTALPDHYLSQEIVEYIQQKNIDTSAINVSGNRIGTYYLPQGADLKNVGVIYDRAHSSFAELKPGMIDWEKVLDGYSWFHFSAISPALNEHTAAVCKEALEAASAKSMTISVDLNYRSKLWKYGVEPPVVMAPLLAHCQVVMGNAWAAESLLGITASISESKGKTKEQLLDAAGKSMKEIHTNYPRITTMAYTFRLEDVYYAVIQHGAQRAVSKEFPLHTIIDKVGSGDCFMAGLIYGLYHQHLPQEIIDYAAAAAFGKLQEKGDATNQTIESIKNTLARNGQE